MAISPAPLYELNLPAGPDPLVNQPPGMAPPPWPKTPALEFAFVPVAKPFTLFAFPRLKTPPTPVPATAAVAAATSAPATPPATAAFNVLPLMSSPPVGPAGRRSYAGPAQVSRATWPIFGGRECRYFSSG